MDCEPKILLTKKSCYKHVELFHLYRARVSVYATNLYHWPLKLKQVAITHSINSLVNLSVVVTSYGSLRFKVDVPFRELDIRRFNVIKRFSLRFVTCSENVFSRAKEDARTSLLAVSRYCHWCTESMKTKRNSPLEGLKAIS